MRARIAKAPGGQKDGAKSIKLPARCRGDEANFKSRHTANCVLKQADIPKKF